METKDCETMDCERENKLNIRCDKVVEDNTDNAQELSTNEYKLLDVSSVPDYAKERSITTGYRRPLDYNGCTMRLSTSGHIFSASFSSSG